MRTIGESTSTAATRAAYVPGMHAPANEPDRRPGPPRLLVPVLVFLGVVTAAGGSLGAPLLPTVAAVEHVSLAASQWALTVSLLVGAIAAPVAGRLGDGRLRRPVVLASLAAALVGCVLSALPTGFVGLLIGRMLQGAGGGLVPLAIATARDELPAERGRPAIALLGVTTAIGIGVGYPVVGAITQQFGMAAAFWAGAAVTALALLAAARVLPEGPDREARGLDWPGATLLAVCVAAVLLALSQGQSWGWVSIRILAAIALAVAMLAGWVARELNTRRPLVDVRLLRHRAVLAANVSVLLVGVGIYPLLSLVVRLVQTPTGAGYGFGESPLVAGSLLVPFSFASFAANKAAGALLRRRGPDTVVVAGCVLLVAAMAQFRLGRGTLWELGIAMALAGFGVGWVFAANPLQLVRGVPPHETGSATGFYQVVRSTGFALGSALSATVLTSATPRGRSIPASSGYDTAAVFGICALIVATAVSAAFLRPAKTASQSPPAPAPAARSTR